ncbi:chemotaxis protein CheY [Plesiocystis pacifica SIR-1]|uniref:Chemotaxis protein CheY n=1 Tax=Plesiocystis pacifica SIR-1 TaxID=391625 RepID=A6G721_9BACT|nr:chemotaxis protein CheY [Plesiocystis pacifica SIR-1]
MVEDSRAMRDYVCAVLEDEQEYEVHEVGNGFDALRALPRDLYGLIVTDINMPDVSGIELTRFVRQTPRHSKTPLIVISSEASAVDKDRAMAAGASAFVAKPFTPQEFLEAIARARANPRPDLDEGGDGGGAKADGGGDK